MQLHAQSGTPDLEHSGLEQRFAAWARRGRPDDLAAVFEATAPPLLRIARHLVTELADAEDLLQSTFVTAMRKAGDYDAARPLLPWLTGILTRHGHELRAKQRRQLDPDRVRGPSAIPDPVDVVGRHELGAEMHSAVDRLSAGDRALLLLELRHGLAPAEIAEVLNRAPGTVRVQLHRARERLRRLLPAGVASTLLAAGAELRAARGLPAVQREVVALAVARFQAMAPLGVVALNALLMNLMTKSGLAVAAVLLLAVGSVGVAIREFTMADEQPAVADVTAAAASPARSDSAPAPVLDDESSLRSPVAGERRVADSGDVQQLPRVRLLAKVVGDGAPLVGVPLTVEPDDGRHPALHRLTRSTDETGVLELEGLEPGRYRVLSGRLAGASRGSADPDAAASTEPTELHDPWAEDLPLLRLPPSERVASWNFRDARSLRARLGADAEELQVLGRVELQFSEDEIEEVFVEEDLPAVLPMPRFEVDEFAAPREPSTIATRFVVTEEAETITRVVALPAGVPVSGRVVSAEGQPVAGALLGAMFPRQSEPFPLGIRTDSAGRFTCADVLPGTSLYAYGASGFAQSRAYVVQEEPGELELVLHPADGFIVGTVRDEAGEPIAGARVRFGRVRTWSAVLRVEADEAGRFGPVALAAPQATVLVQSPGREPYAAMVQIDDGVTRELDVRLRAGWELRGRVLQRDGRPATGVKVRAVSADRVSTHAVSDADGRYALECLPIGQVTLHIEGDTRHRDLRLEARGDAGAQREMDLQRPPAGHIQLRVVDESGAPLVDWTARVVPVDEAAGAPSATGRVDARGDVRLPTWPGLQYALQLQPSSREILELTDRDGVVTRYVCFQGPAYVSIAERSVHGRELGIDALPGVVDHREVRVPSRFFPTARLRGRLVGDDGQPRMGRFQVNLPDAGGSARLIEEDGRFDTGFLMPGAYTFRIEPLRDAEGTGLDLDVTVLEPGQDLDLGDVRLPN